jgi:NADP-dependent 3-hydroxy acid dehydrogenase YdfG
LFALKGWKVITPMRNPNRKKKRAKLSGVALMSSDVTDPHEIERVAEQVRGVGVVFNNAGYSLAGLLERPFLFNCIYHATKWPLRAGAKAWLLS